MQSTARELITVTAIIPPERDQCGGAGKADVEDAGGALNCPMGECGKIVSLVIRIENELRSTPGREAEKAGEMMTRTKRPNGCPRRLRNASFPSATRSPPPNAASAERPPTNRKTTPRAM